MSSWQQILAVDAKYNSYRTPESPSFRSVYLRRRSQLLRASQRLQETSGESDVNYLATRIALLHQRYRVSLEQSGRRSGVGTRSASRLTLESDLQAAVPPGSSRTNKSARSESAWSMSSKEFTKGLVVPTYKADASRALVGGTTLGQNFEFSGVHHIFDQHKDSVTMVKFGHSNASLLACSSLDGSLSICHLGDESKVVHELKKHTSGVTAFDWSMNNDFLVSCSLDGTLNLWNGQTGDHVRVIPDQFGAQLLACIFHPLNPNWVVVGNSTGHVQVLNISTGRFSAGGTNRLSGGITALAFDASGKILWTGNSKGSIVSFIFCLQSGRLRKGKQCLIIQDASITNIVSRTWANREARNPTLLVNCSANFLLLYRVIDEAGGLKLRSKFRIPHSSLSIQSCFSPIISFRQGACVVTGSEDCEVWILDVEKEHNPVLNKLQGHSAPVLSVSFNYDESFLASSDANGVVIVWKRQ